jgi:hypothetical protein
MISLLEPFGGDRDAAYDQSALYRKNNRLSQFPAVRRFESKRTLGLPLTSNTNITGTLYLIQKVGRDMRRPRVRAHSHYRLCGRLHARHVPGSLQRYQSLPQLLLVGAAE